MRKAVNWPAKSTDGSAPRISLRIAGMTPPDPVPIYTAQNDAEAQLLANALLALGVKEGAWTRRTRAQVWVNRADIDKAKPVLDGFERRQAQRRVGGADEATAGPPLEVACEKCGRYATFPAAQRRSAQECPHCGAYLDVGSDKSTAE
jgi:hypothetical protein